MRAGQIGIELPTSMIWKSTVNSITKQLVMKCMFQFHKLSKCPEPKCVKERLLSNPSNMDVRDEWCGV